MTEFQKEIESILSVLEDGEFENASLMTESLMIRSINNTKVNALRHLKQLLNSKDYTNSFLYLEQLLEKE